MSAWPGSAAAMSRAARLTASPITVYWRRNDGPTSPAKTCPPFTPILCCSSRPDSRSPPFRSSAKRAALVGAYSCATGAPNVTMSFEPLRRDVAAHHETAVPGGEPGEHGHVRLKLLDGRVQARASMIIVEPEHVDEDDDRAAMLGCDLDPLRPLPSRCPGIGGQEGAEQPELDICDRRRLGGRAAASACARARRPARSRRPARNESRPAAAPCSRRDGELTALGPRLGERGQLAGLAEHDKVGTLLGQADAGEHEGIAVGADRHADLDPAARRSR